MNRLILLRHAKSSWDRPLADHDRPLARRGERDAPRMADWAAENIDPPDLVLCSTATRCRQTLAPFLAWLETAQVRYDRDLYHASGDALYQACMNALEQHRSVMLVAHNPGLDELLLDLVGNSVSYTRGGKLMTTAAMAVIELSVQQPARLLELHRPRNL